MKFDDKHKSIWRPQMLVGNALLSALEEGVKS